MGTAHRPGTRLSHRMVMIVRVSIGAGAQQLSPLPDDRVAVHRLGEGALRCVKKGKASVVCQPRRFCPQPYASFVVGGESFCQIA